MSQESINNVSSQEKRDALSGPFFKEVDNQIMELDLTKNPFSKELVEKAYGILKYQLPKLDSFIGSREGGGKNSWRLGNKRRELYQKLEAIFEMEKDKRVTNLEEEIEREQQKAKGREIEMIPYEPLKNVS